MENQEDIELMSRALAYLDGLPKSLQNNDYGIIVQLVNEYLRKNCKHSIIEDLVDTAPNSSKQIFYCQLCYQTFDST
jgi:hypothetical protein